MKKIKEKILVMFGIALIAFMLGIITVNAAPPRVSITSRNHVVRTGTIVDAYNLTVDYSQMPDLTNLRIFYNLNDPNHGTWTEITYNPLQTSHSVLIRTGFSSSYLQTVNVRAENDHGVYDTYIELLVLFFSAQNWTHPATGLSGTLMRYPIGHLGTTTVQVEVVTDPAILARFPLLNMGIVYRVNPIALDPHEDAGPLLRRFGISPSTSYITVMYPVPEAARTMPGLRGYVFHPDFTHFMTSQYMPWMYDGNLLFTSTRGIYIYEEGYAYFTIATGIDPNSPGLINQTPPEDILTPPEDTPPGIENPQTGINTIPYILLGLGIIGALVAFVYVKKKKKFHKI